MVNPVARSPRRRQLGALLRRLRKDAGLSGEALAGDDSSDDPADLAATSFTETMC